MKKYISLIMVLVFVLGITTIATADGGFYYGSFSSGFTAGQTFQKVNDKTIEDNNGTCTTGCYTSGVTASYLSILKVGSATVSTATVASGGNHIKTCDNTGTFRLRVENQTSNTLYVRGIMYIYNGATHREITDTSHYWN